MIELIKTSENNEVYLVESYENWETARKNAKKWILKNDPKNSMDYYIATEDETCDAEVLVYDKNDYIWQDSQFYAMNH